MKNRKLVKFLMASTVVLAAGCAQPENDVLQQWKDTENIKLSGETGSGSSYDASIEDGRKLEIVYGSGEFKFNIDAEVFVPSAQMKSGSAAIKDLDISLIEQYLCPETSLTYSQEQNAYISSGNSTDSDLDFDIIYAPTGNGYAYFENFKVTSSVSADNSIVEDDRLTNEQRKEADECQDLASQLFEDLSLSGGLSHYWYSVGDTPQITVFINTYIEDVPLILKESGNYAQSTVNFYGKSVGQMNLSGLFELENADDVSIMPLDDVLDIINQGIESGNIYGSSINITRVELSYFMGNDTSGSSYIYPVWCFSGMIDAVSGTIPILCINAQTGEVEFMSGI